MEDEPADNTSLCQHKQNVVIRHNYFFKTILLLNSNLDLRAKILTAG